MIKSKYYNKQFGNWTCTHVGLANVQGKKSKAPGARNHYYIFERRTSDGLADKMVRLNSSEACKVYRGEISVDQIVARRKEKKVADFAHKVSYHFI